MYTGDAVMKLPIKPNFYFKMLAMLEKDANKKFLNFPEFGFHKYAVIKGDTVLFCAKNNNTDLPLAVLITYETIYGKCYRYEIREWGN